MDGTIDGKPVPRALIEQGVVPFIKIDKGLEDEADSVQLMKPMPELDGLLTRARTLGVFGTKERSVIHLANLSNDPLGDIDPTLTRVINDDATMRLARMAREAGVERFIFSSSCSCYGAGGDEMGDEDSELAPVSLYAETKVAVERAMLNGASMSGMCVTPLRFATVFGTSPRMRFDLTVNEFTPFRIGCSFFAGKTLNSFVSIFENHLFGPSPVS
jgi:nucleoside-diphosphate-sugar epimerase